MRKTSRDSSPIATYEVDDFNDLREFIETQIPNIRDFVFRGQSDYRWKLVSTLNRLILHTRATGVKQESIDSFVKKLQDRFKLEIRGRRGDNPSKLDGDGLWALGQHYGLATPLLDWSRSPYISLFFSLERINEHEEDRALWCLNERKIRNKNLELIDNQQLKFIFPDTDDNKRLLGQSGLFSKGPVMISVDDWVSSKFLNDNQVPAIIKIKIPGNHIFRKTALKKLELMNITHSTIFPDLIGASKYCNIVAEDYET